MAAERDAAAETGQPILPLDGILVLDFSQFLAGPVAAMRLADLGARVIKVERPGIGDIGRTLAFAGMTLDGDTLSFHVMNRAKESYAADLKDGDDLAAVRELVHAADVLIQNFRPGVMERIGLDYAAVRTLNPRLVYGSVSGYGPDGPWRDLPGQDLLAQSVSGLPWLSGSRDDGPVPVGPVDRRPAGLLPSRPGHHGAAAAARADGRGRPRRDQPSGGDARPPVRAAQRPSERPVGDRGARRTTRRPTPSSPRRMACTRPPTATSRIAMNPVPRIGALIGLEALEAFADPQSWWTEREPDRGLLLADHLRTRRTQHWLAILEPADVWCAPVLTLPDLVEHEGFRAPGDGPGGAPYRGGWNRRGPRPDDAQPAPHRRGELRSDRGAPHLGEHTAMIDGELGLQEHAGSRDRHVSRPAPVVLRGMTWDHPRGLASVRGASAAYEAPVSGRASGVAGAVAPGLRGPAARGARARVRPAGHRSSRTFRMRRPRAARLPRRPRAGR